MPCPYRCRRVSLLALAFILALSAATGVCAQEEDVVTVPDSPDDPNPQAATVTNNDFEAGNLSGWTTAKTDICRSRAGRHSPRHFERRDRNSQAPCVGTATSRNVQGLTLDTPPAQTSGGGLNSSLSAGIITLKQPLQPGQSIDVNFWLAVVTSGEFRYFLNIEAQP